MAKVRKKKKPGRGRFTKGLPAGISYTVEGVTEGGSEVRRRVFFVKAVKAETTIKITIYESGDAEDDPEVQAVYDSFDITKKER